MNPREAFGIGATAAFLYGRQAASEGIPVLSRPKASPLISEIVQLHTQCKTQAPSADALSRIALQLPQHLDAFELLAEVCFECQECNTTVALRILAELLPLSSVHSINFKFVEIDFERAEIIAQMIKSSPGIKNVSFAGAQSLNVERIFPVLEAATSAQQLEVVFLGEKLYEEVCQKYGKVPKIAPKSVPTSTVHETEIIPRDAVQPPGRNRLARMPFSPSSHDEIAWARTVLQEQSIPIGDVFTPIGIRSIQKFIQALQTSHKTYIQGEDLSKAIRIVKRNPAMRSEAKSTATSEKRGRDDFRVGCVPESDPMVAESVTVLQHYGFSMHDVVSTPQEIRKCAWSLRQKGQEHDAASLERAASIVLQHDSGRSTGQRQQQQSRSIAHASAPASRTWALQVLQKNNVPERDVLDDSMVTLVKNFIKKMESTPGYEREAREMCEAVNIIRRSSGSHNKRNNQEEIVSWANGILQKNWPQQQVAFLLDAPDGGAAERAELEALDAAESERALLALRVMRLAMKNRTIPADICEQAEYHIPVITDSRDSPFASI